MKKNVSKFLMGIFFCSLVFLGCPQQGPSADSFDPASSNPEVKDAFDKALGGVKSTPKNEEEFKEMITEIITEFGSLNNNTKSSARFVSPSGDAISSKDDITKKIESIINNINTAFSGVTSGTEKEIKFSFDESINIEKATVVDLLDALSGIDELKNIVGNVNLPEEQKKLINDLIKINNLYAKAKADVNVDMEKLRTGESSDESIGSANIELLASAAAIDLEKMAGLPEGETLPIKAASAVISMDANASATYKDVNEIYKMNSGFGGNSDISLSGASLGVNLEGKSTFAVCTKTGKGGKLSFELNASIDKEFLLGYIKILNEYQQEIKKIYSSDDYVNINEKLNKASKNMAEKLGNLFSDNFKVKVSMDGGFSKEYSYNDLMKFSESF